MRARRFFAGKPNNSPPLFDALMDVFVMKENERKAGSFPVPFSPCGMLKPSRDSTFGENLFDGASVSQEKPSPEDIQEVVGMSKKLQDTCRYLKGKSTALHLYRILNTIKPTTWPCSQDVATQDGQNVLASTLQKFGFAMSRFRHVKPSDDIFHCVAHYLANQEEFAGKVEEVTSLTFFRGAEVSAISQTLKRMVFEEIKNNSSRYDPSWETSGPTVAEEWNHKNMGGQILDAISNLIGAPILLFSPNPEYEVQIIIPVRIKLSSPMLLWASSLTSMGTVEVSQRQGMSIGNLTLM